MNKQPRHYKLQRLVREKTIHTQEKIAAELARIGIETTQVTLSRDLRELAIVKTPEGYKERNAVDKVTLPTITLAHVLHEFLEEIRVAQNFVVIKTNPGSANAVALALDSVDFPEIVGTVAGDDTIFVAVANSDSAQLLERKLANL